MKHIKFLKLYWYYFMLKATFIACRDTFEKILKSKTYKEFNKHQKDFDTLMNINDEYFIKYDKELKRIINKYL